MAGDATPWSIVTVTFNSARQLRRYWLPRAVPGDVTWVVVDNASSDDSVEVARSGGARVIVLDANRGFSAANNVGLAETRSTYVGFANPDVGVDYTTLGRLAMIARECQALVAPQLLNPDGSLQPNGRCLPYLGSKLMHRLPFETAAKRRYDVVPHGGRPVHVAWTMGAALCGLASTFRSIGGWDESFFIYYEDAEIGLRAWSDGIPVLIDPRSAWVHGWARETRTLRWAPWKHELASAARFYRRYPRLAIGGARRSVLLGGIEARCGQPADLPHMGDPDSR